MSPNKAKLITTCVECSQSDVPDLHDMCNRGREISYKTFAHRVDISKVAQKLGYVVRPDQKGLRLSQDWCVRFYRSMWKGRPCYYMNWSAIEYIFQ